MPKTDEPSNKAKLFLEEYVRNGFNGFKAYKTIYPNASDATAYARSSEMLKEEKCVKYLREYIDSLNVHRATAQAVINGICDIAFNMDNPDDLRLKALTQLSKILGLEQMNINTNIKSVEIVDDLQ
jgi:hypothetical protein